MTVPLLDCQRGHWAWWSFQWSQSRMVPTLYPCGRVLAYGGMSLGSRRQSTQLGERPWEKRQTRRWWGCSCGPSGWSHLLGYPTHLQNIEALVNPLVTRVKCSVKRPSPFKSRNVHVWTQPCICFCFSIYRVATTKFHKYGHIAIQEKYG